MYCLFADNRKFLSINMATVTTIQSYTVFAWFMLFMVLRRIILLVLAIIFGFHRPFTAGSRVPEDKMFKTKELRSSFANVASIEFTKDVRINKVFHNDSKNDMQFYILLLATAVTATDIADPSTRTIVYGVIYFCARVFYALSYVMAWQPWRTIALVSGLLCTLACSLDLVITMSLRSS